MPNHFHLVLWPRHDGEMSDYMMWLMTAHVRRYHQHYHSTGHVWQGRFRAFPIQEDDHLLKVLRYVERNALRANLVARAEDWRWCSVTPGISESLILDPGPVTRPANWHTDAELERPRDSIRRGRPFGGESWMALTAAALGLEASLRPRGRPKASSTPVSFPPLTCLPG